MRSSDITLALMILLIYILLFFYNILAIQTQNIKENWPIYQCNPTIMPFASYFGHDTGENFVKCIQTMQSGFMDEFLNPVNNMINQIAFTGQGLGSGMAGIASFMNIFRMNVGSSTGNIFGSFANLVIEIQKILLALQGLMGKITATLKTFLYLFKDLFTYLPQSFSKTPGGSLITGKIEGKK